MTSHHGAHTQFSMQCSIPDRGDARDSGLALSWPTLCVWGGALLAHHCLYPGLPMPSALKLGGLVMPSSALSGVITSGQGTSWPQGQAQMGVSHTGRRRGAQSDLGPSCCAPRQLLGKAACF